MSSRFIATGFIAATLIFGGASTAFTQTTRNDHEVAADYKAEAKTLREKAEAHRKMGQEFRLRSSVGKANFSQISLHCEKLAKQYEGAAKEAEAISTELSK